MRWSNENESRMLMPHNEIRHLLPAYVADELGASERYMLHTHLDHCASCQKEVCEIEKIARLLASLAVISPPSLPQPSLADQVLARLEQEKEASLRQEGLKPQAGSFIIDSSPSLPLNRRAKGKIGSGVYSSLIAAALIILAVGASSLMVFRNFYPQASTQSTSVAISSVTSTLASTDTGSLRPQVEKEIALFAQLLASTEPTMQITIRGTHSHQDFSYREEMKKDVWNATQSTPVMGDDGSVGALAQLKKDFQLAQSDTQLRNVYEQAHRLTSLYHAFLQNLSSNEAMDSPHKTDDLLINSYKSDLQVTTNPSEKVLIISLSEQALRVYNFKGYQSSFPITTGSMLYPLIPGVWKVTLKQAQVTLISVYNDQSQRPPEPVQHAFILDNKQTIHDSNWRLEFGPGTQYPHQEKSNNPNPLAQNGDLWGAGMRAEDIKRLDSMIAQNTTVIVY